MYRVVKFEILHAPHKEKIVKPWGMASALAACNHFVLAGDQLAIIVNKANTR